MTALCTAMRYPLNTPLGRMGVETVRETADGCVASIPVGGLLNPLTGTPTLAPLAMLVDHVGGLVNHNRRNPDEWTVSAELAIEFTSDAIAVITAAPDVPVVAEGRPFGRKGSAPLSLCELTHAGQLVATATVRSFYINVPGHLVEWPTDTADGTPPEALCDRLAVEVAESGGQAKVLRQLSDPVINNSIGIVHGGVSATSLELVAAAALNDGRGETPLQTASLRVNFLRQFRGSNESRYEGTVVRVGRSTGVADAHAVGADGKVALLARVTAYR